MTWNYRLVRFKSPEGGYRYEFKEVYYHDDGTPMAYGDPFLWGDTIAEMQELADQLAVAAAKPSVYEEDFGESYDA